LRAPGRSSGQHRPPRDSTASLLDVLDRLLDTGIVIEARVALAVAGIGIAEVRSTVAITSIETRLRPRRHRAGSRAGGAGGGGLPAREGRGSRGLRPA